MRDHTPNTRVTARRMNRVIGGLTSMRSRLEGVSNVVAALRAGIGTVGMSSECSALLALSTPLADALTSETGAVADSAALRAAASQGSRLPAASKSSRGLLIDTNIGHTPHFSWLPLHKRHGAYRFDATYWLPSGRGAMGGTTARPSRIRRRSAAPAHRRQARPSAASLRRTDRR